MPLDRYAAKRRFDSTPEPPPKESSSTAANYFCVQRHDATRLHYDFRLAIDGVLKSWAVPKGPTLDPTVKRLAAQVEDHPLEYGDFEGNIPPGNYGAGSVMLWDRGTFELLGGAPAREPLERGDLKFRLHGQKLNGEFALVRMKGRGKGNEWLLIKKRDEFAVPGWDVESCAYSVLSGRTQEEIAQNLPARQANRQAAGAADRVWESSRAHVGAGYIRPEPRKRPAAARPSAPPKKKLDLDLAAAKGARQAEMPDPIQPMKAMSADRPPRGEGWLFEVKWDGVRAIAFIENEEVRLQSRSGQRCERQYPELAVIPRHLAAGRAVLDGEIAVLDEKGVSRFELIQPRIANTDPNTVAHLARSSPAIYFVFDLLYLDGYDLRHVELARRRELLEAVVAPAGVLRISEAFPGAGDELLAAAREAGLEGIVAKRAASCYESRRSADWLKIKLVNQQEFVVAGFTAPQGGRQHFGALVLGAWREGKLNWVGNVGTGFDQKTLAALHARLEPLITPQSPLAERPKPDRGITWVKPELVCEVKFANWTADNRLRAPVFLGLRDDKPAAEVVREPPATSSPPSEAAPSIPDAKEAIVEIAGRRLKFTNLKKVFFPDEGYTKRDVLGYYNDVADLILPHLKDRPLSLKRYPDGIKGEFFFQKDVPESFPSWIRTEPIDSEENGKTIRYSFAEDRAGLLFLVNLGCIDHNPWMSRTPHLDNPDFVLIDLDPQDCPYEMIVDAALLAKGVLDRIGLAGYPKTTGGRGMHIYIPVEPIYNYEQTRTFAELIARAVIAQKPELFTTPRAVAKRRKNRVYFDYLQNGQGKTIAAPYVLRAWPGAPVATPLEWPEVHHGLHPSQFTLANARPRFAAKGDLFAAVLTNLQHLEEPLDRLGEMF